MNSNSKLTCPCIHNNSHHVALLLLHTIQKHSACLCWRAAGRRDRALPPPKLRSIIGAGLLLWRLLAAAGSINNKTALSNVTTYIAIHIKIIIPSLNSNYPSMCRRSLQFNPTSDSSIVEIYSKKHMRTSLGVVRCFLQCHVTTC